MIRRINFYSGPCCGKSVLAANIFCELKKQGKNIELIQEYAKELAYEKRKIQPYHQLQIFTEQVAREYRVLNSSEDVITVSDSPIFLNIPYAIKYCFVSWRALVAIAKDFEMSYPAVNFFIRREDCPYTQEGRYENLNEAKGMDMAIESFLNEQQIPYIPVAYNEQNKILERINFFLNVITMPDDNLPKTTSGSIEGRRSDNVMWYEA